MAYWNRYATTQQGLDMIAEAEAQGLPLTFTNFKTSSYDYSQDDLVSLTDIEDVEQNFIISEKANVNNKIKLSANMVNTGLLTSYVFRTYGLYANIGGEDKLVFVATSQDSDTIPAGADAPYQSIMNSYMTISNAVNVTINVDLTENATQQYVLQKIKEQSEKATRVTIPTTSWITNTDSDNNTYYTNEINVSGITSDFIGISNATFVTPSPYNVNQYETVKELWNLITDMQSFNGYIKVFASEIPSQEFDVWLYGI